jgi:hypothetical protein
MPDSSIFTPEEMSAMTVAAQTPPAPKTPLPQQEPGYVKKVKPVYQPPEFQQASDTVATPNYNSTLYWNHLINTDEQGHAKLLLPAQRSPRRFCMRDPGHLHHGRLQQIPAVCGEISICKNPNKRYLVLLIDFTNQQKT